MILNEKHEMIPVDLMEWAMWLGTNHNSPLRVVGQTNINGYLISTVFLGLDHNFVGGKPIWFETMVFGEGEWEDWQKRYETWEEAEKGHASVLKKIESGGIPG